jgi:hypothetical protein
MFEVTFAIAGNKMEVVQKRFDELRMTWLLLEAP